MLAKKIAQNGRHITVFYPEHRSGMPSTKNTTPARDRSNDAVARSKNLLKKKLYLSPQLNTFLTLTYAKQNADVNMIQNDLKNVFSRKGREYVAVIERHKSGALHIHAVVNWDQCNFTLNEHKHYTFADWTKGFSNVQKIKYKENDENRVAVAYYITKYITKDTEKIGGKRVYSSRGLLKNAKTSTRYIRDEVFFREKSMKAMLAKYEPDGHFSIKSNGVFHIGEVLSVDE